MQRTWGGGTRSITSSTVVSLAFCRSGSRWSLPHQQQLLTATAFCGCCWMKEQGVRGSRVSIPHPVCRRDWEDCYFLSWEWLSASHGWLSSLIPVGLGCHGGKSNSARRFPPLATLTELHLTLWLPRSSSFLQFLYPHFLSPAMTPFNSISLEIHSIAFADFNSRN